MAPRLTPAEAILHRTGPNAITILFEASGGFDPSRAFRGIQMLVEGSPRFQAIVSRGQFIASPVAWSRHVSLLDAPHLDAPALMDLARRLTLPTDRPLWRAIMVNPHGAGWSGVVLHIDHAIADGTRIARHLLANVRPGPTDCAAVEGMPHVSLAQLQRETSADVTPVPIGLCRLSFAALRACVPGAKSHTDALLRLARGMLDIQPEFAPVPQRRKDHASVARIEALRSGQGLGNHAQMEAVDLSRPRGAAPSALFRPHATPVAETLRMGAARFVPTALLRRFVQAEFSRPGIVLTIVPVSRKPVALFGLPLCAIHPAAPALGRPLLAITAVRYGDGLDLSVAAHGPDGAAVDGLSQRVATAMVQAVQ